MKIQVYTNEGKVKYLSPGQIAPAGWFNSKCEPLEVDHVVLIGTEEGNPYDQYSSPKKFPILAKKKDWQRRGDVVGYPR